MCCMFRKCSRLKNRSAYLALLNTRDRYYRRLHKCDDEQQCPRNFLQSFYHYRQLAIHTFLRSRLFWGFVCWNVFRAMGLCLLRVDPKLLCAEIYKKDQGIFYRSEENTSELQS